MGEADRSFCSKKLQKVSIEKVFEVVKFLKRFIFHNRYIIDWFSPDHMSLKSYQFHGDSIRDDLVERYNFDGDLAHIYVEGGQQLVHKWHHYLPIYDRYFSRWRGEPVRFLEIGVSNSSLK